jgi:archaellum biogenesis protein FlaJ (TadC family)
MIRKWLTVRVSCSVFILSSVFVADAHAYIDPGSGSVLLQLILGGIAGIGVVARLYWDRIKTRYHSLFGRGESTNRPE